MKRFSWSLTTLFVLGVASAFAQQPGGRGGPEGGHRPPPIMVALDADRDHVISAEEIKNAASSLLTLDRNRDGKLTEEEFRGPGGGSGQGNPTGGGPQGAGRRGDTRTARPGSGGRAETDQGRPDKGRDVEPPAPSPERLVDHAMEFDTDNDGKLSKDELLKFAIEFPRHHPHPAGPRRDGDKPGDRRNGVPQRPQRPE